MGLSLGSINTGLPKDIVQQIIAAERVPIKKMVVRKEKFQNKIKLVDELMDLMKTLRAELIKNRTSQSFRELKTSFPKESVNVTADKNLARTGSHQLEVLQIARRSSAFSNGFKDPDSSNLGVGYFSYELPSGEEREVFIDGEHASLNGLAKLINDDSSIGMTAKAINDGSDSDTPWRLLVTLNDTGRDNIASFPRVYLIDGTQDFYFESERLAQNAKVKLDGFEVETSSNNISDLIQGVNIELKKATVGEEFSIIISEDSQKITEKIETLVDNINAILKFINNQNAIDADSDTSNTLGGDVTLTTFQSQLRSIIFKSYKTPGGSKRLGEFGISFQKNGLLYMDKDKFESSTGKNFKEMSTFFNGFLDGNVKQNGFIDDLSRRIDLSLRTPDGIIASRKRGIQSRIKQIDRRIEQRERLVDQKEKSLKNKFAKLESTMNKIKSQGAGLQSLTGGGAALSNKLLG